ncbi:MAG: CoA pyrophosphatase [Rhodospirillaceae bacterium]|nr:CoA pyrophosphatase [Rhodospirillaceae bacterium]
MRAHIQSRLANAPRSGDPVARMRRDLEGPLSPPLLELLERRRSPAAVLLGLIERPAGLTLLFTERSPNLKDHPGQVSFPGGRIEKGDDGPVAAAVREAGEEVGLERRLVTVAGCLDDLLTVTGFLVTPVVAFVDSAYRPVADGREVAEVFEVPLKYFLDERNIRSTHRERLGTRIRVYEIDFEGHRIWGATASILVQFLSLISDEKRTR